MRRRAMVAEDDERQRLFGGDMQARQIGVIESGARVPADEVFDRLEAKYARMIAERKEAEHKE